jgi:hypothetical protein
VIEEHNGGSTARKNAGLLSKDALSASGAGWGRIVAKVSMVWKYLLPMCA